MEGRLKLRLLPILWQAFISGGNMDLQQLCWGEMCIRDRRIRRIADELGLTIIIVTHDPEEALTLSDRVLIINEGKVAQYATPQEIIQSPNSAFVEEFILKQLTIKRQNILTLFGNEIGSCA